MVVLQQTPAAVADSALCWNGFGGVGWRPCIGLPAGYASSQREREVCVCARMRHYRNRSTGQGRCIYKKSPYCPMTNLSLRRILHLLHLLAQKLLRKDGREIQQRKTPRIFAKEGTAYLQDLISFRQVGRDNGLTLGNGHAIPCQELAIFPKRLDLEQGSKGPRGSTHISKRPSRLPLALVCDQETISNAYL